MRGLAKYEPTTATTPWMVDWCQLYSLPLYISGSETRKLIRSRYHRISLYKGLQKANLEKSLNLWQSKMVNCFIPIKPCRCCRKSTTCLVALQSRDLDIVRYAFHAWSRHLEYQGAAGTPPTAAARWEYSMELPIHGSIWMHLMCFFDICIHLHVHLWFHTELFLQRI